MINLFCSSLNTTTVLVIAGQSNAEGSTGGVSVVPPYEIVNPLVKIKGFRGGGSSQDIDTFEVLNTNSNTLGNKNGAEGYLPYYGTKEIFVVKVVKGSTSLAVDWASGSQLRNKLIEHVNEAKTQLLGRRLRFVVYWNQGENEVASTTNCNNYFINYKGMWDEVMAETGVIPNLHLLAKPKPGSNIYSANPENTTILETKQIEIVDYYGGDRLETTGFGTVDGVHYNQDGQRIMCERILPYL